MRYFVDVAQYSHPVQAVAARINIKLPHQKPQLTFNTLSAPPGPSTIASKSSAVPESPYNVLVVPYIRRLVATSFDTPPVLHGFFGEDWQEGIGPIYETERRNFLFACKSDSWNAVKLAYDMDDGQTVPELKGPHTVSLNEIQSSERSWSEWLAMQDWMIGPRDPALAGDGRGPPGAGLR